jgi:hypothetical protein
MGPCYPSPRGGASRGLGAAGGKDAESSLASHCTSARSKASFLSWHPCPTKISRMVLDYRPRPEKTRLVEMRRGRKSRSHLFDGYMRHVLCELDSGLVRAVGITPANALEASVTDAIMADLTCQDVRLRENHLDRGYLASTLVRDRPEELIIYCKARTIQTQSGNYARRY